MTTIQPSRRVYTAPGLFKNFLTGPGKLLEYSSFLVTPGINLFRELLGSLVLEMQNFVIIYTITFQDPDPEIFTFTSSKTLGRP